MAEPRASITVKITETVDAPVAICRGGGVELLRLTLPEAHALWLSLDRVFGALPHHERPKVIFGRTVYRHRNVRR